jgi:hypothetical protein
MSQGACHKNPKGGGNLCVERRPWYAGAPLHEEASSPDKPHDRPKTETVGAWIIGTPALRTGLSMSAGFQVSQPTLPCKGNGCTPKVIIRTRQSQALRE